MSKIFRSTFLGKLLIISFLLNFNNVSLADEDTIEKILETKDLGTYVFGKAVDLLTNAPLVNATIINSSGRTQSDENGEFFIKSNENDFLIIEKDGYEYFKENISNLKGKIKIKPLPFKYVKLVPNIFFGSTYKNNTFSEKFNNVDLKGNSNGPINFNLDASFLNISLRTSYELDNVPIKRFAVSPEIPEEKQSISINSYSFDLGYLFEIQRDHLAILPNIKFFNTSSNTKSLEKVETERDLDYIDADQSRLGFGIGADVIYRPIKLAPYVFIGNLNYYPYVSVKSGFDNFPSSFNTIDYSLTARYDIWGILLKASIMGKNTFGTNFSYNDVGFSLGTGYTF
ncbi:MAG: hypothetical protein AABZ74_08560 [Cyanobacteriota bacterium]